MLKKLIPLALLLTSLSSFADEPGEQARYQEQWRLNEKAANAIMNGDLVGLKAALAEGAKIEEVNHAADDALELAARYAKPEIARFLVEEIGMKPESYIQPDNFFAGNIYTAIALGGSVEILKLFEAHGLQLELPINEWKLPYQTPKRHFHKNCSPLLQHAAQRGQLALIRYLVSRGVNIDGRCGERALFGAGTGSPTPFYALAESYIYSEYDFESIRLHNQSVLLFIELGADLGARQDHTGETVYARLMKATWFYEYNKEIVRKIWNERK